MQEHFPVPGRCLGVPEIQCEAGERLQSHNQAVPGMPRSFRDTISKAMNASSNFRLAFAQRFSQELKSSGGVSDNPQRNATSLKWSYRGRNDMSTFTFGLTLLLLATTGAAQTDNPTFWLLIGPAPFAVVFAGLVLFRHGVSPKDTTKPVR